MEVDEFAKMAEVKERTVLLLFFA